MESKAIVVLALVTLGHISPVTLWEITCIRSEQVAIGLSRLETNQSAAISTRIESLKQLFDQLASLAAQYVFDLTPAASNQPEIDAAIGAQGLFLYKKSINYSLDAIPFALRRSCPGIDNSRADIYKALDDGVAAVPPLIALAVSGNYFQNLPTFDQNQVTLRGYGVIRVQRIYDVIRTCVRTNDADIRTAIETSANAATAAILRSIDAFFDAIKLLCYAITVGDKRVTLINDMEEFRAKLNNEFREEVYQEFGLLKAFYINYCSKRAGLVSSLAAIQYTSSISSYKIGLIATIFSDRVISQVNRTRIGISDDDRVISERNDVAEAETRYLVLTAIDYFLNLHAVLYSKTLREVKHVRELTHIQLTETIYTCYRFLKVILNQRKTYSQIKADIEITKNEDTRSLRKFDDHFISLIRNHKVWTPAAESEFSVLTNKTVAYGDNYFLFLQKQVEILAKVLHVNGTVVNSKTIYTIRKFERKAHSTMVNYVKSWYELLQFSLFANRCCSTKIYSKF